MDLPGAFECSQGHFTLFYGAGVPVKFTGEAPAQREQGAARSQLLTGVHRPSAEDLHVLACDAGKKRSKLDFDAAFDMAFEMALAMGLETAPRSGPWHELGDGP